MASTFSTTQALRSALVMEDMTSVKNTIRDVIAAIEHHGVAAEPDLVPARPVGDDIVKAVTYRGEGGQLLLGLCRTDEGYRYEAVADGWARRIPVSRGTGAGLPCSCRRKEGFTSGWCGVAGGGVPGCDH